MNFISDDKIESDRLEAKLGSFRAGPGFSATDHLNGQSIPAYNKGSDATALAISDSAAMFKRDQEMAKQREALRIKVLETFPNAPYELQAIMYDNPRVEAWLAALAEKEQAR
ncbi:hypothetical protein [Brucella anthropi]|uniref:Uncharacterized protein n=1 Tax=Brucella anthropi TaxID=529 RepID=A0A6L3YZE9_BRUAN|nr:hypothetical protein [Brucella anthropi]KAB2762066.1 hypothetical protein F9L04_22520 [Brucella anthropi]UVV70343.1 hypothetical protein NW321_17540 [Brucella anthropi]